MSPTGFGRPGFAVALAGLRPSTACGVFAVPVLIADAGHGQHMSIGKRQGQTLQRITRPSPTAVSVQAGAGLREGD